MLTAYADMFDCEPHPPPTTAQQTRRKSEGLRTELYRQLKTIGMKEIALASLMLLSTFANATTSPTVVTTLTGVQYPEQVVTGQGLNKISMAGGASIVIHGAGMSHSPVDNAVIFNNNLVCPALSQDDQFKSYTAGGKLHYTLPSLMTLYGGKAYEQFNPQDSFTYEVSLLNSMTSEMGGTVAQILKCPAPGTACKVTYSRGYTPVFYYLQPSVLYAGSDVAFWVDPKSAQDVVEYGTEWPFIDARINGYTVDFDGFVDEFTQLAAYSRNQVRGKMGNVMPSAQSEDVNMKFRVGDTLHNQKTSLRCDYTNQTCYKAKILPVIYSVNATSGYTTGGQVITVKGFGFNNGTIDAKVDGVSCTVINSTQTQFSCVTNARASPSINGSYVGQKGLRRKVFDKLTNGMDLNQINSINTGFTLKHAVDLEPPTNFFNGNYANLYTGYFKAPATAKYRFYMTCDDACIIEISTVHMNTTAKTRILSSNSYDSYRGYITLDSSKKSAWIDLNQSELYYLEVKHAQYSGGDHLTVSVEIEDANIVTGHHHTSKEIQRLMIAQDLVREQSIITISNPDGLNYVINIQNPLNNQLWTSKQISTFAEARTVFDLIRGYYSMVWGARISVRKIMYDNTGNVTTYQSSSIKNEYIIEVNRAIPQASTNYVNFMRVTSKSTFMFTLPEDIVLSTLPLQGGFIIKCALPDGTLVPTSEIGVRYETWRIIDKINQACPNYKEKYDLWEGGSYAYPVDGRDILIRFHGFTVDVPQFQIESSSNNPVVGNNTNIFFFTQIDTNPKRILYEPVPYEFLYTNEEQPSLLVSVGGLEAVCPGLNCSYSYIPPIPAVTGYSFVDSTGVLTITGTMLPNSTSLLRIVTLGNQFCEVTSISSTQIVCIVKTPVAGTFVPNVIDYDGIVPVTGGTPISIGLTVAAITPATNLNINGGNEISITGKNFPKSLDQVEQGVVEMSITFKNGLDCQINEVSNSQVRCTTKKFNAGTSSSGVEIKVNQATDNTLNVQIAGGKTSVTSLIPNIASPVLKSNLTFKVQSFPGVLSKADLSVKLISKTDPLSTRPLNVIDVDNANSEFKVRYGGAYSDLYNVEVMSKQYGNIDASSITFRAIGIVTDFQPRQGSLYGGTLITITGYNFSTDILDNPVRIGYTDCLVESSNNNQIKCRTLPRMEGEVATEDIIVFLKTSEEAECTVNPCKFTWIDTGLPQLTSATTAFSLALNDYVLTLTGTNFGTNLVGSEVIIDNVKQDILSVTNTEVNVKIAHMKSEFTRNVQFYLPVGTPLGCEIFQNNGIKLEPKLISLSPGVASSAGSIIKAQIKGVGPDSTGINLKDSSGANICESVQIYKYGEIHCKTMARPVVSGVLQAVQGTLSYADCVSTNQCNYQTDLVSMPQVSQSTISIGLDTVTLVGIALNNLAAPFVVAGKYAGVEATSVVLTATQAVLTFAKGVPISQSMIQPELFFKDTTSNITHWTLFSASASVSNPTSSNATVSSLSCSFAGGCLLSVSQYGLYSSLTSTQGTNNLKVCGQVCSPSEVDSTSSITKCKIQPLATTYSMINYNVTRDQYLKGTPISTNAQQTDFLFDGKNQNGWTDTNAFSWFGTAFKSGYVGILREVKYFMNRFTRDNFIGKLWFQGSNDGTTYSNIFIVGEEIHEGWNYKTFDAGQEPKFRYYRFFGNSTGSCLVGEISFRGVEVIDSTASSYSSCPVELTLNSSAPIILSTNAVTYTSTMTPLLQAITPRFGTVKGNEMVTFSGTGFDSNFNKYTIVIDGKVCAPQTASATSVTCKTAPRPGLYPDTSLQIFVNGKGNVATQDLLFRYTSYWSDETTWGGEFQPVVGDMVWIPKGLHLLVDVESTPILSAILVEGSLIFPPNADPNHERFLDAHYILVRDGYMEVGTEQFPYTSKLTITMHSDKYSPEIPIYGNKVIGVRNGILDMHGAPRDPVWTDLDSTVQAGANTITLIRSVDWKIGERIVIASTSYDSSDAEERTIVAIDRTNPNKPILTLDQQLENKHFAGIQTFGTDFIEMRAEVGLLSRNVVFRGDPETSALNQFGAHIMLHSKGDESLIGRIEHIELRDVGQAFQLGRYPIHFHMIGTVHNSYVRHNSIHHTYNRAVTIHGVHYLRVINNLAYMTMGHTFFIEDAIETKNYIEKNCAIDTRQSWSLLNTDQTPASFWITNPDNIFRGNRAAGSVRYGFWFDTKPNPMGPSFDPNICPENSPLGEFSNNVAHSNGRYGLRIFHNLIPRTYPCKPIVYDSANITDPYWKNPLITANFVNFTSFKNGRNGAIAEKVGDVRWKNFKVADNLVAGLEFSLTGETMDGTAQINGALVIGYSNNAESVTNNSFSHGIITARKEYFQVHNVKFFNFDVAGKAALGSCSHCFHPAATDSGARTTTFSNIKFDPLTVPVKIRYQYPFRDIFYDLDGSLTGLGPKTWATPYFFHNAQPECIQNLTVYDGLLCNSRVQVRRLVFSGYQPSIFEILPLKILRIDGNEWNQTNPNGSSEYYANSSSYSVVQFKPKRDPSNAWAFPIVTGHKYKMHWGYGVDFTLMNLELSPRWLPTDKGINMVMNFTDIRAKVEMMTGGDIIENATLTSKTASQLQTGDNIVYNDTETRQIHLHINGKNKTRVSIKMVGHRCIGSCLAGIQDVPLEDFVRLWSNAESWDSMKVPVEGEDVEIKPGQNFIFDLEESPLYNMVQINGQLVFQYEAKKLHLRAKHVFVRAGNLYIGNKTHPFLGEAQITLSGEKEHQHMVFTNAIEGGNKILVNTANVEMHGIRRHSQTRLAKSTKRGDKSITVQAGLDWKKGEKIALFPTTMRYYEKDYAIIESYDPDTGVIQLDRPLDFYHFGAQQSTAAKYSGLDIRGEVILLTRNIKIVGNDTEAWGCQVVTSGFMEENDIMRQGMTYLDSVEIYNCSQYDTFKAALRFEMAFSKWSQVSNSVIHHGHGVATHIVASANILIANNTYFSFKKFGINIESSNNITIDGNLIGNINSRAYKGLDNLMDVSAGILGCALNKGDRCPDLFILNNIVSGVDMTGYSVPAHECGKYNKPVFRNNTAHSIDGTGAIIFRDPKSSTQSDCLEGSYFNAYKVTKEGVASYTATNKAIFSNMILLDNMIGAALNIGKEGNDLNTVIKDSKFYGQSDSVDCSIEDYCNKPEGKLDSELCFDRTALIISYFSQKGKEPIVNQKTKLPYHKVKSDASWGGNSQYENLQFIDYKSDKTFCGQTQKVITLNPLGADYIPRAKFIGTRFENVEDSALAYLFDPPSSWAGIANCGNFPCTAPSNVLIQFERTTFAGSIKPSRTDSTFQIVPNNPANTGKFSNCKFKKPWNAYYCNNENLGILLFESLDNDKKNRMITPIYVESHNTTSVNKLNTFMDHIWDGFYTGQLRLSRWPALIQTGTTFLYNVNYTGTAPGKQRFKLIADQSGITVRIRYTKAGSYVIKDSNGNLIKHNEWDKNIKAPAQIKGGSSGVCGENRYVGVVNIFEFFLKPGCTLFVEPIDSIQAAVRLSWTMDAFYAAGGTTKFVDRLAASLGIHASNIKIVSVYQGSVVVQFQIFDNEKNPLPSSLKTIQTSLSDKLSTNKINLGATVIGADIKNLPVSMMQDPSSTQAFTVEYLPTTLPNQKTPIVVPISNPVVDVDIPLIISTTVQNNTVIQVTKEKIEVTDPKQITIMIAAMCTVVLVVLLSLGIFIYYKKCAKTTAPDGAAQVPNTSISDSIGVASTSKLDEIYEDQYHPKAMADLIMPGDINFTLKKNNTNYVDSIISEAAASNDEDSEYNASPDKQRAHTEDDSNGGIFFTKAGDGTMKENTPLHEGELDPKQVVQDFSYQDGRQDLGLKRRQTLVRLTPLDLVAYREKNSSSKKNLELQE